MPRPEDASRNEWKSSWRVAVGCTVGVGTGAGLYQYLSSLFIPHFETAYGWTRGESASALALGMLGTLAAPLIGVLADRVGVRRVMLASIGAVVCVHLALSMMTGEIWVYSLLVAMLAIAAPGTTSLIYSRVIHDAFDRSRGLALGIMSSGLPLATLMLSPLFEIMMRQHGPSAGFLLLAALAGGVGLPIILFSIRPVSSKLRTISASPASPVKADATGSGIKAALLSRNFWFIAGAMIFINAPAGGILTQLAPLLTDKGLPGSLAAWLVSVFAMSVLAGRIGVGWLIDHLPAKFVAVAVTLASAAGCLLLIDAAMAGVFAAVILIGLMQGSETDLLAYFIGRIFGLQSYSTIYGLLFTISLLATASGAAIFGQLFDATQNYDIALALAAAMLSGSALFYGLLPRRFDLPADLAVRA